MQPDRQVSIQRGKILLYRVFDVGNEIDLEKASLTLEQGLSPLRFRLKKESRAIIINNAPLTVSIGLWQYSYGNRTFDVEVVGKLWYFGAISITFHVHIPSMTELPDFVPLAMAIENDPKFTEYALQKVREITGQISSCIDNLAIWETYEDYTIYFIEAFGGTLNNVKDLLNYQEIYSLLLADSSERFSDQMKKALADNYFQYGVNDLALVEWNSALVIEPSGLPDITDVVEFSLCQLLEMRYYDDLLDTKLNQLYSNIIGKKKSVLSDHYAKMSQEAAQKYLELSEIVENIENSLKIIGDFYLARIYRAASTRFRIKDWQASVDNKLGNLAEVSKILNTEVSEKRSTLLEFVIIVLIAVEVVPLIAKYLFKF